MRNIVMFVLFVIALAGCQFDGSGISYPIDRTVDFRQLDIDCDGFIAGEFMDACDNLTTSEADRQACIAEVEEELKVGSKVQGLMANDCDDGDATVYPGAPELCDGKDNDCNGPVDDGIVCQCLNSDDCDDGVLCNGTSHCDTATHLCVADSNSCESMGLVCDAEADQCVGCLETDDCAVGYCNPSTNTCVECLELAHCDDDILCNGQDYCDPRTNTCESFSNVCDEGQVCDAETDQCVGCVYDSDCTSTRPADLGEDWLWGCSTQAVEPDMVHMCTSCLDADGDGYCGAEICANGLDDDGDGAIDEECSADPCDPYGAQIRNISGSELDFVYHTYVLPDWTLDIPPNHLEYPLQNFGPMTLAAGASFGGDCLMGIDAVPTEYYTHDAWVALTAVQQLAACVQYFSCNNADGVEVPPQLNPVDELNPAFRACLCAYNAVP